MTRKIFFVGLFWALTIPAGTALAEPTFNPGKWEITTKTEMTGVPGMQTPAVTHTQCLEKGAMVPQSEQASEECQVSDIRMNGNNVSWKIVCSGQGGEMSGTGEVTYYGNTLKGTMHMVIQGAGMKIKNTISGQRIGPCD